MNSAYVFADIFVHYRNQQTVTQRDTKGDTVFPTDDENQHHIEGLALSLTKIYDQVLRPSQPGYVSSTSDCCEVSPPTVCQTIGSQCVVVQNHGCPPDRAGHHEVPPFPTI